MVKPLRQIAPLLELYGKGSVDKIAAAHREKAQAAAENDEDDKAADHRDQIARTWHIKKAQRMIDAFRDVHKKTREAEQRVKEREHVQAA